MSGRPPSERFEVTLPGKPGFWDWAALHPWMTFFLLLFAIFGIVAIINGPSSIVVQPKP